MYNFVLYKYYKNIKKLWRNSSDIIDILTIFNTKYYNNLI